MFAFESVGTRRVLDFLGKRALTRFVNDSSASNGCFPELLSIFVRSLLASSCNLTAA